MAELPLNPSDSVKRRNPHLYPDAMPVVNEVQRHSDKAKIRMIEPGDKPKLNKTEARYLTYLRHLKAADAQGPWYDFIGIQCLRFQLAEKCWYLPDFIAIDEDGMKAIDVKAKWKGQKGPHVEDDAAVKIKLAARLYPWCRFSLAWEENGQWQHKEIHT